MKKLYEKKENGRYAAIGYSLPDLSDGIWLVQTKPTSQSVTSLAWRVGDLKRPVDIVTHASLQAMEDDVSSYIRKLRSSDSEEYKEAEKLLGGYLRGAVEISGISASDLASLILRKIAIICEGY